MIISLKNVSLTVTVPISPQILVLVAALAG
jgi:hypothetical protein